MFKKEDRGTGREQSWQEPAQSPAPAQAAAPSPAPAPRPAGGGGEQSVISARLKVVGNLESDDDLQIRGRVEGDISCQTLIVAEGATVEGAVSATAVEIKGTIKGRIDADKVRIAATGHMDGDIVYQTLAMEEGAVLDGNVQRRQTPQPAAAPAPKPAAPAPSGGSSGSESGSTAKVSMSGGSGAKSSGS